MVYVMLLIFLAGPLEDREFVFKEDNQNITEFQTLEDCIARAKTLGPKLEKEFKASGQPELQVSFKLGCKAVEKV
ncbi:MAG TPA: hypothetical protein PKV98_04525 [Burkholderiaceae bacterium]|nr:hypothetical protein [Burkholderiaceae bacterium]